MKNISVEELRTLLSYQPETGRFFWNVNRGNIRVGQPAGCLDTQTGYEKIQVCGRLYHSHRLAWLYQTGAWPENFLDHINGLRNDNRFSNLRDVTQAVNLQNQKRPQKNNKCGFLGVFFRKRTRKFASNIKVGSTRLYLGEFETAEEAHAAYLAKKRELHGGCII